MKELIAQYEAMKAEKKSIYLDSDQFADIADWYASERKFVAAQEVLTYGLNLHPDNTELLVQQAYLFLDTHKLDKAKQVLDSISDPYAGCVKLLKAEILMNEGNIDEADKVLESLDEHVEQDLLMLLDICYLYLELGYPEKAIGWMEKGLPKFADEEDFLAAVADCYNAAGHLAVSYTHLTLPTILLV